MTHSIPHDDLTEGQWICTRDRPEEDPPLPNFLFQENPHRRSGARRERAAIVPGRPMRILAVDLPFLHVAPIDREGDEMGPYILDLRDNLVVRSHAGVAEAYRAFNRGRQAARRQRAARERREEAMQQVELEIERHRRLQRAGLIAKGRKLLEKDAGPLDIIDDLASRPTSPGTPTPDPEAGPQDTGNPTPGSNN